MSLWSEIRQRRITQIVITYLAAGWMVLAVIDQVVDREVLPSVFYQVALTLFISGIFGALIIGWYHGEKGAQKAPKIEIAMLVLVAIGGLGASAGVIRNAVRDAEIAGLLGDDLRDLAVLYFEDVTAAGGIQATADGVTEGLISAMREVDALNVSSRNASREVRGLDVGLDSIARILEVGALIDGAVDQRGDELRVSVRLLEASTGTVLLRETYEWPADSVASVGTELAAELAEALREQLGIEIRLRESQAAAPSRAAWLGVARAERYLADADEALVEGDVEALVEAFENAESELEAAAETAPEWPEPLVLRSRLSYERYVLAQSTDELIGMMDEAVEWANRALAIEPDDAGALEWRGTAAYRRWLLGADDPEELDDIFRQAQADLERSILLDSDRASVNSTLSHLYYQTNNVPRAIVAGREAYTQDAFLDVADAVLWRLYTASYDTDDFTGARQWCEEGNERFPDNYRFLQCQIFLMTMQEAEPDIDRAWGLYEDLGPLLVERPEFFDAQARLVVGGVIGRTGLLDSARAVIGGVEVSRELDPGQELLAIEGAMRSVAGDVEGAVAALERYLVAQDGFSLDRHWWWDNIRSTPEFERVRVLN